MTTMRRRRVALDLSATAKPKSTIKVASPYAPAMVVPLHVRFYEQQMDRMNELRSKTGVGISELIRRAVDEYLDRNQ